MKRSVFLIILIFLFICLNYKKFEKELNINCLNLNNTSKNFYTYDRNINTSVTKTDDKYKFFLEIIWLKTPNYRGEDIIGVLLENAKIINTSIDFELQFNLKNKEYKTNTSLINSQNNGVSVLFKLPRSKNVKNIVITLSFDFVSDDKEIDIYSDYAHLLKKIKRTKNKNYFMSHKGLILDDSIYSFYDDTSVVLSHFNLE